MLKFVGQMWQSGVESNRVMRPRESLGGACVTRSAWANSPDSAPKVAHAKGHAPPKCLRGFAFGGRCFDSGSGLRNQTARASGASGGGAVRLSASGLFGNPATAFKASSSSERERHQQMGLHGLHSRNTGTSSPEVTKPSSLFVRDCNREGVHGETSARLNRMTSLRDSGHCAGRGLIPQLITLG